MKMQIIYRISTRSRVKEKLHNDQKVLCLKNATKVFSSEDFLVIADNCDKIIVDMVKKMGLPVQETTLGNSASWRLAATFAIKNLPGDSIVYFLEDDYLHLPGSVTLINEGIKLADYVSLYDHPDKYIDAAKGGPNPFIQDGGELTKILLSQSSHWKYTNSTTMTFATTVATLIEDLPVWWKYTVSSMPLDFEAFLELTGRKKGLLGWFQNKARPHRRIVTPLPGRATHTDLQWLCPLVDWTNLQFAGDAQTS